MKTVDHDDIQAGSTNADQYMEIQKGQAGGRAANEHEGADMAVGDDRDTWSP